MSKRDREIREMLERAWGKEEKKRKIVYLSEREMRRLPEYYRAGAPYGDTPEGFIRWLEEQGD